MPKMDEARGVTPQIFREEILPAGRPLVLRCLVGNWPVVQAARESAEVFSSYIKQFDRGYDVDTAFGPPSIAGRIFYNEDLSGLNCRMESSRLSSALDYLLANRDADPTPTLAIQSVVLSRYVPGLGDANRLPAGFVPDGVEPRLWLGSRGIVAAHYDPSDNIACCIAGRRRFTLLPPEQVENLYVGPFELTPAGTTISMVNFDHPDLERYPRFRDAERTALTADLEPGDAIYVPYLWWHHVRSLDSVNGLINYWWSQVPQRGGDPRNALLHAMMTMRDLPAAHRDAWRAMFEHYVFGDPDAASAHLPPERRGILGEPKPDAIKRLRLALSRALSRN